MIQLVIGPQSDDPDDTTKLLLGTLDTTDPPLVIGPFHYAWSTGLSSTVEDEVRLALSSLEPDETRIELCIEELGLSDMRHKEISTLSGGWAKYTLFGLALYVAGRDRPVILQAVAQYLDDALINRLVATAERHKGPVFFVELDPLVLVEWKNDVRLKFLVTGDGGPDGELVDECTRRFGGGDVIRLS